MRARRRRHVPRTGTAAWALVALVASLAPAPARAQTPGVNPVYIDDAPLAVDAIIRVEALARAGNHSEAVRVLQRLLDESPFKLAPAGEGGGLYVTVRRRVHDALLADEELLARYREAQDPLARTQLAAEGPHAVERSRFLTPAGLEATLRLAQVQIDSGYFEAAHLTLAQLQRHPDFSGRPRRDAAELMDLVAAYLDRDELRDLAQRWADAAGERRAFGRPATERVLTPLGPAPATELRDVVSRPLHSREVLGANFPLDRDSFNPWIVPIAAGDDVIVNDGTEISAWDRFTLQPRWRTRPGGWADMDALADFRGGRASRRLGMTLRDASWVAAGNDHVVAITGYVLAYGRGGVAQRQGDPRAHAFDRRTGEHLWSWHPSFASSDLADTTLQGPPLIHGDLVIFHGERQSPQRRLWASTLYAVDLYSGEVRWQRPIASAGALPYQTQAGLLSAATTLHNGVLYRVDPLGAAIAVVAATGRPLWVRTLESRALAGYDPAPPHATSQPIIDGDAMVSLTPDRREVVRISLDDGRVLASSSAAALGSPRYLLRVGDRLAGVSDGAVGLGPIDDIRSATTQVYSLRSGELRGRAVVSGEHLVVPIAEGLAIVEPGADEPVRHIPLEHAGALLVLEGQFIVAAGGTLHSYLVWDIAETLLRRRMEAAPHDPMPAITFAELSLQSRRHQTMLDAVDRALAAVESSAPQAERERRHLYALLIGAVREPGEAFLAPSVELAVLERLGRAARSASERVGHLLELGLSHERHQRDAEAIDTYQQVLLDEELSSARWAGPGLATRAGREATRRIRRIVADAGPDAYAAFADAAHRSLDAVGAAATAPALEALAQKYPAAPASARAWLLAAQQRQRSGEARLAAADLRQGLEVAQVVPVASETTARLAGQLAGVLLEQHRHAEALAAIAALPQDATALVAGRTLGREEMQQLAREAIARRLALPTIGDRLAAPVEVLEQWSIARPLAHEPAWQNPGYALLRRDAENATVLRAVEPAPAAADSPVAVRWTRELPPGAELLRADPGGPIVVTPREQGPLLLRLEAQSGRTIWSAELGGAIAVAHGPDQIDRTPMAGPVRRDEPVLALGERIAVAAGGSGEIRAIDLESGSLLWSREVDLHRALDAEISAGLAVVAGERRGEPVLVALDLSDGRPVFEHDARDESAPGGVRLLRDAEGAGLVVAIEGGLRLLDPFAGDALWQISEPWSRGAIDAWTLDGLLLLLTADRDLVAVDLASGRRLGPAINDRGVLRPEGPLGWRRLGGRIAIYGPQGLLVVDASGGVAGADASGRGEPVAVAVGAGRAVLVDRFAPDGNEGQRALVLDDTGRAVGEAVRLRLGPAQQVQALAIMDGAVLIEADGGVVAVAARTER